MQKMLADAQRKDSGFDTILVAQPLGGDAKGKFGRTAPRDRSS